MNLATHCEALMSTELTLVKLVRSRSPNVIRVIHGRTCAVIELGKSPGEDSCQRASTHSCQTCHAMAQLVNMLAYDNQEWCEWLMANAKELTDLGIANMTKFQPNPASTLLRDKIPSNPLLGNKPQ